MDATGSPRAVANPGWNKSDEKNVPVGICSGYFA